MDAIRVSKVERVLCNKAGLSFPGTLHLTAHHLIFHYDDPAREETWVPYPLIALVSRLPLALQGQSPLSFRCRTFELFTLVFETEGSAIDVFDSIKELTVATSIQQLYAFFYSPSPPLSANDGWALYSPREEFGRMGVGTRTKAWRFTDINKDYTFCPTYPARLVVPTRISDTTLQYASKYRSKCRIPALTYLHWSNFGTITRSSQPMVGLTANRSIQDEKLIEAVFHTHHSPDSRVSAGPVYGATTTNLIIDARPTTNAVANTAKGAGTENMDHYKEARKAYLGIDNIHVVRDSLARVVDALSQADSFAAASGEMPLDNPFAGILDRQTLRRSGWLRHISAILEGTVLIVRNVHVNSSHVLIHCSDGWDRTAQLSSLSQLCLDPYFRTTRGFQVLIEKDWLSFGHRFLDRCGHLSSEKFFQAPTEPGGAGGGAEAAQAFFASVQNRFASQSHLKETSPVFHQFLECVRQIQRQYPERFEFNERFLRRLHHHLYSCQFGSFLMNCERERRAGEATRSSLCERTVSVWDFFNSSPELEKNRNPIYDRTLDDPASRIPRADMGVLIPNVKNIRFWHELYGRTDEEMNGRLVTAQAQGVEIIGPIDTSVDDPVISTSPSTPVVPSPSPSPAPPSQPLIIVPGREDSAPSSPSPVTRPSLVSDISSFRAASPSSVTLQPVNHQRPLRSPSPSSPSPSRPRANPPDIFGVGVKSMWGRLSSSATTAFSAVQGAYDGVSKDFKGLSLVTGEAGDPTTGIAGGELKSKEQLNTWGGAMETASSRDPAPVSSYTVGSSANPWATTKHGARVPSVMLDNPWSSARPPSAPRHAATLDDSLFATPRADDRTSLPEDPTVAHVPALSHTDPLASSSTSSTLTDVPSTRSVRQGPPPRIDARKGKTSPVSDKATDPLGVGPL